MSLQSTANLRNRMGSKFLQPSHAISLGGKYSRVPFNYGTTIMPGREATITLGGQTTTLKKNSQILKPGTREPSRTEELALFLDRNTNGLEAGTSKGFTVNDKGPLKTSEVGFNTSNINFNSRNEMMKNMENIQNFDISRNKIGNLPSFATTSSNLAQDIETPLKAEMAFDGDELDPVSDVLKGAALGFNLMEERNSQDANQSYTTAGRIQSSNDLKTGNNVSTGMMAGADIGSALGPVGSFAGSAIGGLLSYSDPQKLSTTAGDVAPDPKQQVY
jgi:hypothetical protein